MSLNPNRNPTLNLNRPVFGLRLSESQRVDLFSALHQPDRLLSCEAAAGHRPALRAKAFGGLRL